MHERRRLTRVLAASGLLLVAAGCGSATSTPAASPSAQDLACREQWRAFADQYDGRDGGAAVSDLADRWAAVLTTARYYASGAKAADCDGPLTTARQSASATQSLTDTLRAYDVPWTVDHLSPDVTTYLLNSPDTEIRINGKPVVPPSRHELQDALGRLATNGPAAVTDMQSGWDEAVAADLSSSDAVAKTMKDMKFLAHDSAPYQECVRDLAVVQRAVDIVQATGPTPTPSTGG